MAAVIVRLDQQVVNRIAAGEVIQRPSNALKEMIENSLDAGSTSISVTVKGGGLQSLVIQDNGHGINQKDFPLVCERFATSKLVSFEDLLKISTYGFRGEALASISHVARVTIVSMTAGAACAYRAAFSEGRMVGEAKACAGVQGTTITVEDMFYNVPARRQALKNTSEEHARILEVLERYAIKHSCRGVSFMCKKMGDAAPDRLIPAKTSPLDAISAVFGAAVRKELLPLSAEGGDESNSNSSSSGGSSSSCSGTEGLSFQASGYVSNVNLALKRPTAVFFINSRLVDCTALRKALEGVYAELLPKGAHPFLYLDIKLPTQHVDVNVHPTKREVGFLYQDELVSSVSNALSACLQASSATRTFATQTLLPGASAPAKSQAAAASPSGKANPSSASSGSGGGNLGLGAFEDEGGGSGAAAASRPPPPKALSSFISSSAAAAGISSSSSSSSSSAAFASAPGKEADTNVSAQRKVRVDHSMHGAMNSYVVVMPREKSSKSGGGGSSSGGGKAEAASSSAFLDLTEDDGGLEGACCEKGSSSSSHAHGAEEGEGEEDARAAAALRVSVAESASGARRARRPLASLIPVTLRSVKELLAECVSETHSGLCSALKECLLVGVVDRHLSLLQHGTRMLLIHHTQFARELFYQQALRLFSNAAPFRLHPPLSAAEAVALALDAHELGKAEERPALVREVCTLLREKAALLQEYFSVEFRGEGPGAAPGAAAPGEADQQQQQQQQQLYLNTLPRLLDAHTPLLQYLPDFLLGLAYDVNWDDEKECFRSLAQCLAAFYAHPPPIPIRVMGATVAAGAAAAGASGNAAEGGSAARAFTEEAEAYRRSPNSVHALVAQVLLPGIKAGLLPPRKLCTGQHVIQVASTEKLYSVFERC